MKVKALKPFISTQFGNIEAGQILDGVSPSMAANWESVGMVEAIRTTYDTKVVQEVPQVGDIPLTNGPDKESLSSQAAPASPKKTRKSSKAKKSS
jgi:hypothetical protein